MIWSGTHDAAMARLSLTLLGGFQARLDPGGAISLPTKKAQALLAYLALPLGPAHPRDKLAALLWGGIREESARNSLRQALFALRKALTTTAPPSLTLNGDTIALDRRAVSVDVADFERLLAAGKPEALERASALYRGDLLAGLAVDEPPFEEWLLSERERLREFALEGLAKLLRHQREAGTPEAAVQTALKLLSLDPLQEPVHRTIMRLYTDIGRRGAALRQYQHCVAVLQRELGVEPEPETRQLYQEILQRRGAEPASAYVHGAGRADPSTPRTGIHRLDVDTHETPLIGRAAELAQLGQAFDDAADGRGRVVMVIGEAGIGKTAIVQALVGDVGRRGGRILLGRSYESEQILPFGPWVDAFRTGRVTLDTDVLGQLPPVWRAELARLLPEIQAPGLPSPSDDRGRLFESVAQLAERLAAVQPLVLLLEDLHWADEMSVRLLSFLGRRLDSWPVLIVGTAREEEMADAAPLRRTLEELRRERSEEHTF